MKTKSIIYVIVAGVLWGTSGIFVHYIAPFGFTSLQMTATRAAVSFLGILGYVLIAKRELLRVKFGELPLLLGIGASLFRNGRLLLPLYADDLCFNRRGADVYGAHLRPYLLGSLLWREADKR